MNFEQFVQKMMMPIRRRVDLMISRAVIKTINLTGKIPIAQTSLLRGEIRDAVEIFQQYGFASGPIEGCEGVAVFIGGDRSNGIVIATEDRRYRLSIVKGEVAIFTDEGDKVHLKRGRTIEVVAGTKVIMTTPVVEVSGNITCQNLNASGNVSDGTGTVQAIRDAFNPHTHVSATAGNPTSGPTPTI